VRLWPQRSITTSPPLARGAGIEPADLPRVLDEHAFSAVWGSGLRDLLAQDLPDGRNVVDDYLKRRGWKESLPTREYMTALRRSVLSLYEASEVIPGQPMTYAIWFGERPRAGHRGVGVAQSASMDRIATRVIPNYAQLQSASARPVPDRKSQLKPSFRLQPEADSRESQIGGCEEETSVQSIAARAGQSSSIETTAQRISFRKSSEGCKLDLA